MNPAKLRTYVHGLHGHITLDVLICFCMDMITNRIVDQHIITSPWI